MSFSFIQGLAQMSPVGAACAALLAILLVVGTALRIVRTNVDWWITRRKRWGDALRRGEVIDPEPE